MNVNVAQPDRKPDEHDLAWKRFTAPRNAFDFYGAWLDLISRQIGAVTSGVVLAADPTSGGFVPLGVWPDIRTDVAGLREAAEAALRSRAGTTTRPDGAPADVLHIAYPLLVDGQVSGIVVLAVIGLAGRKLIDARRALEWGVGWLEAQAWQQRAEDSVKQINRAALALDMLAAVEEQPRLRAASIALSNAVTTRLNLSRAAVGLVPHKQVGGQVKLHGVSSTAYIPPRSPLARAIGNAMEEAIDQNATICAPVPEGAKSRITAAHAALRELARAGAVASFPLVDRNIAVGALTIESREGLPLDAETLRIGEAVAALLGPLLALKARQQRLVSGSLVDWLGDGLRLVLGRRRPTLKLAVIAVAAALAFITFYPGDFRISADASIEGEVQRTAVAPFAGFIAEAPHRAGDTVAAGDVLAALDDRDLRLDELKWQSEVDQLEQQRRQALARGERADVALLNAQMQQAEAQVRLAAEKRRRTTVVAPIDGIVLAGDLSQRLGSPVEQGEMLFTVAPLDAYRVVLNIAEGDLKHIGVGQAGELLLSGVTTASFPLTITAVTPVANVIDGDNVFRVEAAITQMDPVIRPGMEGVAKVFVDKRPLIAIWSRSLIDWARMTIWTWVP